MNILENHTQLVLTLNVRRQLTMTQLGDRLAPGLIASVLLYDLEGDDHFLQQRCQILVPFIQSKNVAAIVSGDPRMAIRTKADGIHFEGQIDQFRELADNRDRQLMLGFGNPRNRHSAMQAGELEPDYLFFGKLGADNKEEAHGRNLSLAQWWAELMEIPAIVQAGVSLTSVHECVTTGAEFIGVESLLFGEHDYSVTLDALASLLTDPKKKSGEFFF